MSQIAAKDVMALRQRTGLGMMECKKALVAAGGNIEEAVDALRKAGIAKADSKADRATNEGRVAALLRDDGSRGVLLELACETDFVAKNEKFNAMLDGLCAHIIDRDSSGTDIAELLDETMKGGDQKIGDLIKEAIAGIGENMSIVQFQRYDAAGGKVGSYIHHNGKVGVLIQVTGDVSPTLLTDLCLHVAATAPAALKRDDIDPQQVERERDIAADQVKDKPAQIIDKIVKGKMDRWFGEQVLLEQPFVKDDKKTVTEVLTEAGKSEIVAFSRFHVGG